MHTLTYIYKAHTHLIYDNINTYKYTHIYIYTYTCIHTHKHKNTHIKKITLNLQCKTA